MAFKIEWIDGHREPKVAPNPAFPDGIDVDVSRPSDKKTCQTPLPYPAKRCGAYLVECLDCGLLIGLTTAGRPDDPRSLTVPCKPRMN